MYIYRQRNIDTTYNGKLRYTNKLYGDKKCMYIYGYVVTNKKREGS